MPRRFRVLLALLLVHLLVAAIFIIAWVWSPSRSTEAAAGDPALEANMQLSAAEASAARQALRASEKLPDLPEPVEEAVLKAVEDTLDKNKRSDIDDLAENVRKAARRAAGMATRLCWRSSPSHDEAPPSSTRPSCPGRAGTACTRTSPASAAAI